MSGSFILFLILMVGVNLLSQSQKKKQKEAQRRQAAQQAAASMDAAPAAPKPRKMPALPKDDRFPELSPRESRPSPGKPADAGAQGRGRSGSMRAASLEGIGSGGSLKGAPETKLHHTVKPFTESAHAHVESSITGISADCPPDALQGAEVSAAAAGANEAYSIRTADNADARRFAFDQGSIRQGFLYGELLGRPKALRR